MRVLVTGSRKWSDSDVINKALNEVFKEWVTKQPPELEFVVVHGGAPGADFLADQWARKMGVVESRVARDEYRADWENHGLSAGHKRNQEMLDTGINLVLAFQWSKKSPGTKGCIKMAKRMGIVVKEFHPPKLW